MSVTNPASALALQVTTGPNGFALQAGTPTILTWTAPNDGALHRFIVYSGLNVTSNETGGLINIQASPSPIARQLIGGGLTVGYNLQGASAGVVLPGGTVSVVQATALSLGAAVFYGEIWGS